MSLSGLAVASRYSYPPNSLSLCGPDKKADLKFYAENQKTDKGTLEILSQFSTLYPYLQLIAQQNKLADPFDPSIVEAYWLGNHLLHQIPLSPFVAHLSESTMLKKKLKRNHLEKILKKLTYGGLPHHSFHVLNIYKRTGHLDIPHTLATMDACLINWGKIKKILPQALVVETAPLIIYNNQLRFGPKKERTIMSQGKKDVLFSHLEIGDFVSYHWGYFCQKLTSLQLNNLIYYTNLSIKLANL